MNKNSFRWIDAVGWIALVAVIVSLYMIFIYVPTEATMGIVQRIFYFHIPSAFIAFLSFLVVFICSILYLSRNDRKYDIVAYSSAEIGVVFCTLVLIEGSIWARPAWGTWWTWDPRLTTTLILWFIYVAYIMIRMSAVEPSRKARFSAVLGIIGFIDVPIVFMAIRWWRTIHPVVLNISTGKMNLESSMIITLLISIAAFIPLYVYVLSHRVNLEQMRDELDGIKRNLSQR